ncbi:hypothetical protein H2198_006775 [Neophaeococcomyces mojaviensis]|uniref:Uncharacterized protein n=1 Tax=Neophaeococcomyces mojaviensis TaxID=3383035 RepID=A0ACC3A229_9EURO|nr:hypothetical protein H2198_006775 [Knufia sp. JES_112]
MTTGQDMNDGVAGVIPSDAHEPGASKIENKPKLSMPTRTEVSGCSTLPVGSSQVYTTNTQEAGEVSPSESNYAANSGQRRSQSARPIEPYPETDNNSMNQRLSTPMLDYHFDPARDNEIIECDGLSLVGESNPTSTVPQPVDGADAAESGPFLRHRLSLETENGGATTAATVEHDQPDTQGDDHYAFQLVEEELADEKLKSAYYESETNRLVAELMSLHAMDAFRKDDSYIVDLVKELRFHIKTWSRNYPTGKIPKTNLFSKAQQEKQDHWFGSVVSDPKMYLREDSDRKLQVLLQGYLWMKLMHNIFKSLVWTGGVCVHRSGPGNKECKLYKVTVSLDKLVRESKWLVFPDCISNEAPRRLVVSSM